MLRILRSFGEQFKGFISLEDTPIEQRFIVSDDRQMRIRIDDPDKPIQRTELQKKVRIRMMIFGIQSQA